MENEIIQGEVSPHPAVSSNECEKEVLQQSFEPMGSEQLNDSTIASSMGRIEAINNDNQEGTTKNLEASGESEEAPEYLIKRKGAMEEWYYQHLRNEVPPHNEREITKKAIKCLSYVTAVRTPACKEAGQNNKIEKRIDTILQEMDSELIRDNLYNLYITATTERDGMTLEDIQSAIDAETHHITELEQRGQWDESDMFKQDNEEYSRELEKIEAQLNHTHPGEQRRRETSLLKPSSQKALNPSDWVDETGEVIRDEAKVPSHESTSGTRRVKGAPGGRVPKRPRTTQAKKITPAKRRKTSASVAANDKNVDAASNDSEKSWGTLSDLATDDDEVRGLGWQGHDSKGKLYHVGFRRDKRGTKRRVKVFGPAPNYEADLKKSDIVERSLTRRRKVMEDKALKKMPKMSAKERDELYPPLSRNVHKSKWMKTEDILKVAWIGRKPKKPNDPPVAYQRHRAAPYAYNVRGELYHHFWQFRHLKDNKGVRILTDEDIKRVIKRMDANYELHESFPSNVNAKGEIFKGVHKRFEDARDITTGQFVYGGHKSARALSKLSQHQAILAAATNGEDKFDVHKIDARGFNKKSLRPQQNELMEGKIDLEDKWAKFEKIKIMTNIAATNELRREKKRHAEREAQLAKYIRELENIITRSGGKLPDSRWGEVASRQSPEIENARLRKSDSARESWVPQTTDQASDDQIEIEKQWDEPNKPDQETSNFNESAAAELAAMLLDSWDTFGGPGPAQLGDENTATVDAAAIEQRYNTGVAEVPSIQEGEQNTTFVDDDEELRRLLIEEIAKFSDSEVDAELAAPESGISEEREIVDGADEGDVAGDC
ncbi:hypothetical protein BP6252_12888 [Coleophoma cylindrospora]|uniref:Uncharacterized protein n=1 Tax=Coleophoma cylindrospora TaxID=1849047 RepID=A0A3D8QDL2_9HELO|nr:hypothetical protein BP6252_12888 [Coleophoma cylindrospora]